MEAAPRKGSSCVSGPVDRGGRRVHGPLSLSSSFRLSRWKLHSPTPVSITCEPWVVGRDLTIFYDSFATQRNIWVGLLSELDH